MGVREMIGEVLGKEIIEIGNIVIVHYGRGKEAFGRLNEVSKNHIKVGNKIIKVENVIKIKKKEF